MILGASIGLIVAVLLYLLLIRQQDLPYVEPHSPTAHLDERKAAIYENIRDANFEFLMGKLSEQDYQQTKADLQQELSEVNTEIASATGAMSVTGISSVAVKQPSSAKKAKMSAAGEFVCRNCGARFGQAMKFCGECGQPMREGDA